MRVFLIVVLFFQCSFCLYSQNLHLEPFVKVPLYSGTEPFIFGKDPYRGYAPREIVFINGRTLFIPQITNAILFDIHKKKIEGSFVFPVSDSRKTLEFTSFFTFSESAFTAYFESPLIARIQSTDYSLIDFRVMENIRLLGTKPYYLKGLFFYYTKDGKLVGMTPEGQVLTTAMVITKEMEWHKNTWYADPIKRNRHKQLIETGEYLIVDGIFYPSIRRQARDYFAAMGMPWSMTHMMQENVQLSPVVAPIGVSFLGDFGYSTGDAMILYNQEGFQLASIDTKDKEQWYKVPEDRKDTVGTMLFAVHPNGDFYALQSMQYDSNYFYRTLKTWGTDLVKMAREGVISGSLEDSKKVVQNLSNQELKLLRNTFFALQGYYFTTWELKNYFLGYEWYQPNPTVTNNTSGFTPEQKRLFDLVVMEEGRRQAEVAKLNGGVSN